MSDVLLETHRGKVVRVFFSNPETPFTSGVLKPDGGGEQIRFAGKVLAEVGNKLEVTGNWTQHPRFGRQFDAQTGVVRMDESPEALAHLLATDDRFVGLGPVRARRVVDAALAVSPDGTIASALESHVEEIAARSGAPLEAVRNAAEVWCSQRAHFAALAELTEQGWSGAQAQLIVHQFGETVPAVVRADPYLLIGKIQRFGFRTVDAVARKMGVRSTDPARLLTGVAFCLQRIGDDGHTWTTRGALLAASMQELRPDTLDGRDVIQGAIQRLVDERIAHLDAVAGTEVIADARVARDEFEVFEKLVAGLGDCVSPLAGQIADPSRPHDYPMPISLIGPRAVAIAGTLNDGQGAALRGFARFRFAVVAGGAGVGKTYLMRAVCDVAEESGLKVALCAPTGKAAKKLALSTGRDAMTIHRLLEPQFDEQSKSFRFTRYERNPIECDLLVVDEISMADIRLMRSLLAAVPASTRVIFVGDHNQIPSVSAGAILRDVLSAQARFPGAIHILNEVVRQAGILARNTRAVLDGVVVQQPSDVWRVQKVEKGDERNAEGILAMMVEQALSDPPPAPFEKQLDLGWDVQVLAPKREGPLGTYALNVHLQKLRQRMLGNAPPDPVEENKPPRPLPGDRIIWTWNDYELELFNGTQALVAGIGKDGSMDLLTEDRRTISVPPGKRKHVEVAYAMTIHKSQGSEWPLVFLVVSSSHYYMRDRNLLYTGVGRAERALVLFGDAAGIRAFAESRRSTNRQTFGRFYVTGWRPGAAP